MVQDVNQARADLELLRFASPEVLAGRKIDVVDRSHVADLCPTDCNRRKRLRSSCCCDSSAEIDCPIGIGVAPDSEEERYGN